MLSSEGKAAETLGLAAAGGNSPHVFVIRGNKKKKRERGEELKKRRRRGAGGSFGGTWRPDVSAGLRGASGRRCETAHRVTPHLVQIDRRAAEFFPDEKNIWKN